MRLSETLRFPLWASGSVVDYCLPEGSSRAQMSRPFIPQTEAEIVTPHRFSLTFSEDPVEGEAAAREKVARETADTSGRTRKRNRNTEKSGSNKKAGFDE
ncbi:unnamed protein product, partial [Amoebophrya sp. A25]|eukprot:GSA25T00008908001.1